MVNLRHAHVDLTKTNDVLTYTNNKNLSKKKT